MERRVGTGGGAIVWLGGVSVEDGWGSEESLSCAVVSLGELPRDTALEGVPRVGGASREEAAETTEGDVQASQVAAQTASLMALLHTRSEASLPSKVSRVWLGEGLGSVAKKTHERMLRWEAMDLGELRPRSPLDRFSQEDTQKLVVLPGFEVSQAKQKPIADIVTWAHCFARYTGAMAAKFPSCTGGFMAHMVIVMKAYVEVEDPAWRLYDEAYREKMAATGCREWAGMDVQLYQEVCAGRLRRARPVAQGDGRASGSAGGVKRPRNEGIPGVCWQFNADQCKYGQSCKYLHACGSCHGPHPRSRCPRPMAEGMKRFGSSAAVYGQE